MRIRTLMISLLAVFALGAVASASASAAATCYPAAVAKTGNYASSEKCEKKEKTANSEWVKISKLENEVEPDVWCAKVAAGEPSTFEDNKCTKAKVGTGEFIKVVTSSDQWEVCEKGGTEKFEEHKCSKKSSEGEWSWKVLEAGKSYKVTSKKAPGSGPEVLTVGTLTISCTEVTNKGTITGGKPGTDLAENITFTGCTTGTTGCAVHSPTQPNGTIVLINIPTKLEQRVVGEEEVLVDNFEQNATTKEFVTLEFSGTTCAAAKYVTTKVKGGVAAEVTNLTNGEVNLDFPEPALEKDTLEAFGLKALFTSPADELSLENGWALRAR